jgi:hypothetical protein
VIEEAGEEEAPLAVVEAEADQEVAETKINIHSVLKPESSYT